MAERREIRAVLWESEGAWRGRLEAEPTDEVTAGTRRACLAELVRRAHAQDALVVSETPVLAGVAEAAAILEWDKRRVITYLNRGSFPEPIAALASGRVWRREDVEAFAREYRRRRARRARRRARHERESVGG